MDINQLKSTVSALLSSTKGLLAADESTKTITSRFEKLAITSNPETNLAYRTMLFTAPGVEEFLSGVILYDETIRQSINLPAGRQGGMSVPSYLQSKGIIPGIKVDKGAVDLPNFPGEKITEGLDGLRDRLEEYAKMGAKFTKWRAVIKIGDGIPTDNCLTENAKILAEYALLVQEVGMVPIIEPEVIREGAHDIQQCAEVTAKMLKIVFERISAHKIALEGLILKTNMVTAGEDNPNQASVQEVAKATIDAFLASVPKELPGIVFLSGGQSPDMATENLNAIAKIGPSGAGWQLSYSFARALQDEPMKIWSGKDENVEVAQKAFVQRGQKVSLARQGKLS